jgi:ABC-type microcin C transport system duplicated ATPase subunit YejF
LQTKDYDMVLSTLSLGLRKDISNIFLSDMVSLNPSLYINQSLSNEISKYFLLQGQAKQQSYETIQAIYQDSIPLGFVTKIHQFYYNRNQNPSKHISRLP